MQRRTAYVIFHLSEDKKYLVEVKRYKLMAYVEQWCSEHRKAEIFVYCASGPELSSWLIWSHTYKELMRIDGPTLHQFYEVLNTYPPPFGHPDTWEALSDREPVRA